MLSRTASHIAYLASGLIKCISSHTSLRLFSSDRFVAISSSSEKQFPSPSSDEKVCGPSTTVSRQSSCDGADRGERRSCSSNCLPVGERQLTSTFRTNASISGLMSRNCTVFFGLTERLLEVGEAGSDSVACATLFARLAKQDFVWLGGRCVWP